MESIIQDPNVQELIREWKDKGRADGRADEARFAACEGVVSTCVAGDPDVQARIDGEPDLAQLESWLEAAVTATAIGDVFRDS